MNLQIVQEKRGEIERIQREFASQLSRGEILKSTAQAINGVLARSIPKINKGIKGEYNITQKYLSRQAKVKPKANSSSLWGGIEVNAMKLPVISFKPKQSNSAISVAYHKGASTVVRDSFIARVQGTKSKAGAGGGDHIGVFSRGHYEKGKPGFKYGKEKTPTGKVRITQRMGPSVFGMARHKDVADSIVAFMGAESVARLRGILQSKVDKIASK